MTDKWLNGRYPLNFPLTAPEVRGFMFKVVKMFEFQRDNKLEDYFDLNKEIMEIMEKLKKWETDKNEKTNQ